MGVTGATGATIPVGVDPAADGAVEAGALVWVVVVGAGSVQVGFGLFGSDVISVDFLSIIRSEGR
jgi:hypothetical protein